MQLLLNTTKTMDLSVQAPARPAATDPVFLKEARALAHQLKGLDRADLARLMGLSDKLADETRAATTLWGRKASPALPAIFAFTGLVYKYLGAPALTAAQLRDAQQRVHILSGLYGVLRPMDLVESYRLEMGSKLAPKNAKNLVEFWKDRLTAQLNAGLKDGEPVLSVAAQEYTKAIDLKKLKGPLIPLVFKEEKPDGSLKTVAVHSKMARGALARFMLTAKAKKPADLMAFGELGWEAATEPPDEGPWLFTRPVRG